MNYRIIAEAFRCGAMQSKLRDGGEEEWEISRTLMDLGGGEKV